MKAIKVIFLLMGLAASLTPALSQAAGGGATYPHDKFTANHSNKGSLQRGASAFSNYCMGCHGASLSRFNRVAKDLGIPDDIAREHLIDQRGADGKKIAVGSLMRSSMTPEYGEKVFGTVPPDLSLTSRSRGSAWIYNYLRGFYLDESRPMGFNNGVFKDVGMPHVLWELQGTQKPIIEAGEHGEGEIVGFETVTEGELSTEEYAEFAYDLANFMDYLGEPYKATRQAVGVKITMFLLVLAGLTYALKREFWRDVV